MGWSKFFLQRLREHLQDFAIDDLVREVFSNSNGFSVISTRLEKKIPQS